MAKQVRGVRLRREERLEVRPLISRGSSFKEAAAAARCSKKTVQRLLSSVEGMRQHEERNVQSCDCRWPNVRKFR